MPNILTLSYTELKEEPSLLHNHAYTEVIIPQNNSGVITLNQNCIKMQKGYFYIIPPSISHSERNEVAEKSAKYFAIKLNDEVLPKTIGEYPITVEGGKNFDEYNAFLNNAYSALASEEYDEGYAVLNLSCFYHALIKHLKNMGFEIISTPGAKPSVTKEIQNYLIRNYSQNIKISDVARLFGISHSALIKNFKKDIGVSPKEFLNDKRIAMAKEMLKADDTTVTQISSYVGFLSPAYFTYIFRQKVNMTPKEYREKYKGK
jgi:AraC-like DNA-binding protein